MRATVRIISVRAHSRAEKAGIEPGDILISVNENEIRDVLDYRFYLTESFVRLDITRDGKPLVFDISKGEYDDIGLEFETPLMDKKQSCRNKCIFCFIDQLPGGMRESLYFKDDDARLSFLHGNYITLTNLTDSDIDRIIKMRISPVNVSVHTMNPELRCKMMNNRRSGEVLGYLPRLAAAKITLRAQVVLCRGVNDGVELDRTMRELCSLYPALDSVSIVPAGLTAHRGGLYPLTSYTPEECKDIISQIESYAGECLERFGDRLFYCADELYVRAGAALPSYDEYGEFAQLENGVGMLALFSHEFYAALGELTDEEKAKESRISIATGEAAYGFISRLVESAEKVCYNLHISLYKIKNEFFGGEVTVTGLLTGRDLAHQLRDKELGDRLLLSGSMLNTDNVFLCGMTPGELSGELRVPLCFTENDGGAFLFEILGLN